MTTTRSHLRPLLVAVALVLAFLSPAARAQQQTGGVLFVVTDPGGGALKGVGITLSGDKIGASQFLETDEFGRAVFSVLPPGKYLAEFSASGYMGIRRDVVVALGAASTERIVLAKGEMTETVKVSAAQPIDPTEVGSKASYGQEVIQNIQLGSGSRSYQSVVQQTAGVAGGGNPDVRGSTLGENVYLIDGVNTTDPVTGTFGLNTIFDSVDTVEVGTGGFQAEYGQITGGVVNQITKSGTNKFSGSFDTRYYDEGFQVENTHYPDEPLTYRNTSLTLGGPIVKDKFFYFIALEDGVSEARPGGANATRSFKNQGYAVKLSWQVNQNHRLDFQTQQADENIDNDNADFLVAAEAGSRQEQPAGFSKLTYWGRLTDRWTLSAQAGFYSSRLDTFPLKDTGVPSRTSYDTGYLSENYNDAQYSKRYNNQLAWSAEYFTHTKRQHQIKFGMDWQDRHFKFERQQPGGSAEFWGDPDGSGVEVRAEVDTLISGGKLEDTGGLLGIYLQDKWQITRMVSLSYGLRDDFSKFDRDDGTNVVDVSLLQPRVGMAFDLMKDGKDVFTWHYGRTMHPGILTVANAVNSRADATRIELDEHYYGDLNGDGDTVDLVLYDENLGGPPGGVFGGPGGSKVAKDLDPTKLDELQIGHSHAFKPNLVFTGMVVWRYTNDIIEDTDEDNDGIYEIKNIDALYRRYFGVELGTKWNGKRWHVMGNWTISKAKGNIEYTQSLGTDWDYLPQHSVNHDGYMSYDRRNRIKVQGWGDLPKKWYFGWNFFWGSGAPFNHLKATRPYGTEFVEPRGSQRLPIFYNLDTEVRKTWTVKKTDLTLIGTISNFLNSNIVTGVQTRGADTDPSDDPNVQNDWGEPTAWSPPRSYEVGFRVTW